MRAQRCEKNPILSPASSATLGQNLNGPSVIRVPDWIVNPLGTYYMYFAHHNGVHIRLAYADHPAGPWTVYEPGVMRLCDAPALSEHIASPDVHVDHAEQRIRMYVHGPVPDQPGQYAIVTCSADGLHFTAGDEILGRPYFRVWFWRGWYYAIDGGGFFNRSRDPLTGWESRSDGPCEGRLIPHLQVENVPGQLNEVTIRHSAVCVDGDELIIIYSRKGDAPERLLYRRIQMDDDWHAWKLGDIKELLRPEKEYEGIAYPLEISVKGSGLHKQELRDPCIFIDDEAGATGETWLYYSIAGEDGIAVARLCVDE